MQVREVKESVTLKDGRTITIDLTADEHHYLLSYAVNHLIANGMMALGEIGGDEVIGEIPDKQQLDS